MSVVSKSILYLTCIGETKANPAPSFELLYANTENKGTKCDATSVESEYTYAATPECTPVAKSLAPNTAGASTSRSNAEPRTGRCVQHKLTDSTAHLIKDEGSGAAVEGTVPRGLNVLTILSN